MLLRTLLFLSLVLLVLGGTFTYLARRSMAFSPTLARHPGWVWGSLGLFLGLVMLVPLANRLAGHQADFLYWLSYGFFSFLSTFLVYLALADLIQFLVRRLIPGGPGTGTWVFPAVVGLSFLSVVAGAVMALRPPVLRTVEVPVTDLPPGLEGFRIVQISDLHLGPLVPKAKVEELVERVNGLRPDLIALTGDLVDGEADGVRGKVDGLGALKAEQGIFFVTGNHEYYSGVGRWLPIFRGLGWQVLENEHRVLEPRGAQLVVAGLPDPAARGRRGTRGPDLAAALAGTPPEAVKVLLFHPPTGYEAAERAGVRLQLSGHTHAGQYFPWSLLVQALFRYPKGLHQHGRMWIYTSVGTGFWGPPNRFLVPPELTLLTMRRK